MELRQLETFRTAAKNLSFTRTAAQLNYAQSSVSAQIQSLEEELGVTLFDRLGRRIRLTDKGQELLAYAERILDLADEAQSMVTNKDEPSGSVVISAPETLCVYRLPAVLQEMRERYPQVQLTLQPSLAQAWRSHLNSGEADAAIVLNAPVQLSGYRVEVLRPEPIVIIAPPNHPLVDKSPVVAADLQEELVMLTEPNCSYRNELERTLRTDGIQPTAVLDFTSVEAIKHLVMGGMGLAQLPLVAVATEVEQGRLAVIDWQADEAEMFVQLVIHRDKWLSPAMRAFIEVAEALLKAP